MFLGYTHAMNMMMVAASAGQGVNPGLPSQEAMMFTVFLAVAGVVLLTAAALMVRSGNPSHALRYTRARRDLNNF